MREIDIPLVSAIELPLVERAVEEAVRHLGLTVTLRGTLKKYPGCIHWHVKNGSHPGTLEVTVWPSTGRAWLTIQDGRRADWIDDLATPLAAAIRERLTG